MDATENGQLPARCKYQHEPSGTRLEQRRTGGSTHSNRKAGLIIDNHLLQPDHDSRCIHRGSVWFCYHPPSIVYPEEKVDPQLGGSRRFNTGGFSSGDHGVVFYQWPVPSHGNLFHSRYILRRVVVHDCNNNNNNNIVIDNL